MKRVLGVFVAAVAMLATVNAQSSPITFRSEIYLVQEVTGPNGSRSECLTPATKAGAGDLVEYRIFATNSGETTLPAGVVQIYGPVQSGMEYAANTATPSSRRILTEFSVDGTTFSAPPVRVGSGADRRMASPSEYTMIRWTLLVPVEPGDEEPLTYRVRLSGERPRTATNGTATCGTATNGTATSGTSAGAGFQILSVNYRWEGEYLFVVGELQNVSGTAMGVELQAIARDASGRLVDTVNFWPASISNIAAGARYGFRYAVTQQRSAVTVEVQVVTTVTW